MSFLTMNFHQLSLSVHVHDLIPSKQSWDNNTYWGFKSNKVIKATVVVDEITLHMNCVVSHNCTKIITSLLLKDGNSNVNVLM